MTKQEVVALVRQLQLVFDAVRIVDVSLTTQYRLSSEGELVQEPYACYAVWNKTTRCENCISAKAFSQKGKFTKFEFINDDVYHVIAMYLEMEGTPYVLEMVTKINEETLFGAYGRNVFAESIACFNRKLYLDALTGAYNRLYYEEQQQSLVRTSAIAMIDVDNFKEVNDEYGHLIGDMVLRRLAETILENLHPDDVLDRYGGDEFLVVFAHPSRETFLDKLETLRKAVEQLTFPEHPEIHMTVSIGGVYRWGKTQDLVDEADRLLYQAKDRRNTVIVAKIQEDLPEK
ncbi:MAG: GGDEF domain-containing protein [Oscillospiraceae bacterium]|nr:GGDEF domain-containing protein [Oscillospiraceae bacterium]